MNENENAAVAMTPFISGSYADNSVTNFLHLMVYMGLHVVCTAPPGLAAEAPPTSDKQSLVLKSQQSFPAELIRFEQERFLNDAARGQSFFFPHTFLQAAHAKHVK